MKTRPYTTQVIPTNGNGFSPKQVFWFITLLVLVVLCVSASFFSNQSLRLDEAQSLWQTSHGLKAMFTIVSEDVHVPLYHVMLHFWQFLFGSDVFSARMLSLIFFY